MYPRLYLDFVLIFPMDLMKTFELTESEIKGLNALNNEISEDVTKKVIVNAVKQLLVKGPGKKKFNYFI